MHLIPVITIDGPTASGKGTVASRVASTLRFHYLDSGALYRLLAFAAVKVGIDTADVDALSTLAASLEIEFAGAEVRLGGEDVGEAIRAESIGNAASALAVHMPVRTALLARQRVFRRAPGLVADGRDMGSVVFPDAILKIFLTASVDARAERRTKQLMAKGIFANITSLSRDLEARDARDSSRQAAPLIAARDAITIDSSEMGIVEVVQQIVDLARSRGISF